MSEEFDKLDVQDKIRVNNAILEKLQTFDGAQEYRKVVKAAKESGGSLQDAYQAHIDAERQTLSRNVDSLPPFKDNGIDDKRDLGITGHVSQVVRDSIISEVERGAYYQPDATGKIPHYVNLVKSTREGDEAHYRYNNGEDRSDISAGKHIAMNESVAPISGLPKSSGTRYMG